VEAIEVLALYREADLNWFAAYFAVFNVGLAASGQVQHHRNFFSAIWTGEFRVPLEEDTAIDPA